MDEILLLLTQGLSLLLPILVSGIFFIFSIKNHWLEALNRPIDAGLKIGGARIFGPNKNWRAPIIYILFGTIFTYLLHVLAPGQVWIARIYLAEPISLGLATTSSYAAAELVNSFVKRRLGRPAGAAGGKVQSFFDNVDGALASGVVLLFFGVPLNLLAVSFILSFLVHAGTDKLMRSLKLKESKKKRAG
jgi:CDP-archaeol synthase